MPADLEEIVDKEVYKKLKKIRQADLSPIVPDNPYLSNTIDGGGEFRLRPYQRQMVWHMVLMRRFVCGDATGLGKCVTPDSWVRTEEGLKQIGGLGSAEEGSFGDISEDTSVRIDGNSHFVSRFYSGGEKQTVKIQTHCGFSLEGTPNHRIRVWDGKDIRWCFLGDLSQDDTVCIDRHGNGGFSDTNVDLNTEVDVGCSANQYDLPDQMTAPLARLYGYMVGEGGLSHDNFVTVSQCPEANPEVHEEIISLIHNVFGYDSSNLQIKDKTVHSVWIRRYLENNGLGYTVSRDRSIPPCILQSKKKVVVAFLQALFEGEAYVYDCGGVEFSTASSELATQVHQLLLMFGIVANLSERKQEVSGETRKYYRLTIFGKDAKCFQQSIGFCSDRKSSKLRENLSDEFNPNRDLLPDSLDFIEKLRSQLLSATTVEGANAKRKGSGLKQFGRAFVSTLEKIRNDDRDPSWRFFRILRDNLESAGVDSSEKQTLDRLLDRSYFFDSVTKVKKSRSYVVDLEVPSKHEYVANGFVNHNTIETIGTLAVVWKNKGANLRPLVLTEKSARGQWRDEINKFMVGVEPVVLDGSPDERVRTYRRFFEDWDPDRPRILITNYAKPRIDTKDRDVLAPHVEEYPTAIVADEATHFKSPSSKTHGAIKKLMTAAERGYGLTATLIKNRLQEGYGIFKAIYPNVFGAPYSFRDKYCQLERQYVPNRGYIKKVAGHAPHHIKRFKKRIDPFYFGRAKHEVADELPVLTTKTVRPRLSPDEWALYERVLGGNLEVDGEKKGEQAFEKLAYTQQIVDSPELIDRDAPSSKKKALFDLLEGELKDDKVIVFSKSRQMVDILQRELEDKGWTLGITDDAEPKKDEGQQFVRVTGAESGDERDAARRAFTDNDATELILLTSAGKHALNLQEASAMIFYDLPWSGGNYLQLLGRMIRIGSSHQSVLAIHLVSEGPGGEETIDLYTHETIEQKRDLIDSVLGKRLEEKDEDVNYGDDMKSELARKLQSEAPDA